MWQIPDRKGSRTGAEAGQPESLHASPVAHLYLPGCTRHVFTYDVEVGFSRARGALLVLLTIDAAPTSFHMAAYTFTSRPAADALLKAQKRGVDVRVVVDRINAKKPHSEVKFLFGQGVAVRTDRQYSIMHNKFIVADGCTVEEGSFNYTSAAANRNAENADPWMGASLLQENEAKTFTRSDGSEIGVCQNSDRDQHLRPDQPPRNRLKGNSFVRTSQHSKRTHAARSATKNMRRGLTIPRSSIRN